MSSNNKEKFYRGGFYVLGLLILAMGIILNTKSSFGVAPIVSMAYSASQIWGFNFSNASLVVFVLIGLMEFLVKGKKFRWLDLLQLPMAVVFTRFFGLFGILLPTPETLPGRLVCLFSAITCTGVGAALTLNARLVPNPADGFVQAVADCLNKEVGLVKNIFDFSCICVTVTLGLVMTGKIIGIGFGTFATMLLVGRVISIYNRFFKERTQRLSGMDQ